MTDLVILMTNTDSEDEAQRIADRVVERSLAAAAQVIGPVTSTYRWRGELCRSREWMCLIKSDAIRQRDVEREIRAIHSYELPGIIAVPIVGGDEDYLSWYAQSLEVAQPPRGESS